RLWASIGASPEMNLGALKNAKRRTARLMSMINEDAIYNAGLVEEYGSAGQNEAFLRANPFVRGLMTNPETDTGVVQWTTDENGKPVRVK
ncbi:unnamed protein product, partial [marine sediment metagenome]